VAAVDDATGTVPAAVFREQEDAHGYFLLLREVIRRKGVPLALYSDRHGIFQRSPREPESLEEQLSGRREPTQLGRALKELGIQQIFALSPQAKGRVERLFGTFQDRLVAELRMAGARTVAEANQVLKNFLPPFNARFGVPPAQEGWAYRRLPKELDLDGVLCFKYQRTMARDNTVRFGGRTLQILPGRDRTSYAHARVEVQERLHGGLIVCYKGQVLATQEAPPGPVTLRARKGARVPTDALEGLGDGVSTAPFYLNGAQGRDEVGSGFPHQEIHPHPGDCRPANKPAPHHPWRKPLMTKSRNT
jgi:hypothetical protein